MQLGRFEELGSGILNVNKYIKAYSGKDNPQFIEGTTFKTIIPIGGAAVDGADQDVTGLNDGAVVGAIVGAIDGATKGVREKLKLILKAIATEEGKRMPFYKDTANLDDSDRTIERYMQQLREANLIEFKGEAAQTGGYYLTDALRNRIKTTE